ncbi:MAG: photosynthetic reaction center cytochrome c subunit [Acidobacteriia bacterium]|nr:photosynthetic reaction center cytochrome c subunit [Terriglobia bacterium]
MKFGWRPLAVAAGVLSATALIGIALVDRAQAQAPPAAAAGKTAGQVFKNVTTASLKDLTVDDFLSAMGVISADLGLDCADCHPGAGSDKVDWVIDPPRKKMTRRMIDMLAAINKNNFAGAQAVTCFSCHHGRLRPSTTIQLDKLYGPPNEEQDDIVAPVSEGPTANQILDKYTAALGGAQKLASLKSFIATGTSVGYGGLGGGGSFHIYAQAPDKRTVDIEFKDHPERGDSTWAFNGKTGWVKSPRGLLKDYDLTGGELNGQKLDAELAFPGQMKQVLTNLRVGVGDDIGDHSVDVVQGTGPGGELATLSFDRKTGLLVRIVRYARSPVGRVPVQYDYDDYRDVSGIKFPFKYTFSWLDGRQVFQLSGVEVNVPINEAIFNKGAGK